MSDTANPADIGTEYLAQDKTASAKTHHKVWYRGEHTNRNPDQLRMVPTNAVEKWVLKGWIPDAPLIDRSTKITAFGSCFAANISRWLGQRNYRVSAEDEEAQKAYVVQIGEGMVNSFVIRQQFEWAWENKSFEQDLWHGYTAESYGYDEEVRAETKKLFDTTEVFILTFGLSEVWYDEPTDNVFWRTIPKEAYDPSRHKFRVASVEENRENIDAIYQLIRKHRPDAKVIFTLSPVPLIATFRDNSCITSNSVSKASLRVAIDEVMRAYKDEGHLFYWPSYEIVMDVFGNPIKEDRRHLPKRVLAFIMTQFEHVWCKEEEGDDRPSLKEAWIAGNAAAGNFPHHLESICLKHDLDKLRAVAERNSLDRNPEKSEAIRKLVNELIADWEAQEAAAAPTPQDAAE